MKKIIRMAVLIALSFLGSLIEVPKTMITFDLFPGYFSALCTSPIEGGIIALLGYLATVAYNGFPLSNLGHGIIAIETFVFTMMFGYINKIINPMIAIIFVIIFNGVLIPFSLMPMYGKEFSFALATHLSTVTLCNVVLATVLYIALKKAK